MMSKPKYRLVHPINKLYKKSGRVILENLPPDVIRSIPKIRKKSRRKKQVPEYVNQLIKNPGITIFDHDIRYEFEKPYWIDAPQDSVQYKVAMKPGRIALHRLSQESIANYLAARDCLIRIKRLTESELRQHRGQHGEDSINRSEMASTVDADQSDLAIDSIFSDDSSEEDRDKELSIDFSFMNETIDLPPSKVAQDSTKHHEPVGHNDDQAGMDLEDTDSENEPSARFIPLFSPMRNEYVWYDTRRNEEYADELTAQRDIPKSQPLDANRNNKVEITNAEQTIDANDEEALVKVQPSTSAGKYHVTVEKHDTPRNDDNQQVEITSAEQYVNLMTDASPAIHADENLDVDIARDGRMDGKGGT